MATQFVKSERLRKLPPYLFAEIDKKKKAAIAAGRDVINLGVGDPDRPTPTSIIRSLQHHVENPAFHQYALDQGAPELRRSIAAFCKSRYDLDLDPETEILVLIGSKEGLAHLPLAVLNPGEISLVPDPCYPVYRSSSMFAGADVYTMPLEPALGFRPDLDAIPADVFALARLMFLNYPNNPDRGDGRSCRFSRRSSSWRGPINSWSPRMRPTTRCTTRRPPPAFFRYPGPRTSRSSFTVCPRRST